MSKWNVSDKHSDISLSNGDLTASNTVTGNHAVRADVWFSTGKYYWEVRVDASGPTPQMNIGVATVNSELNVRLGTGYKDFAIFAYKGRKVNDGTEELYSDSYGVGDVVGVAVDFDAGKIWFSINGVWGNGGNPAAGTGAAFSNLNTPVSGISYFPAWSGYDDEDVVTGQFDSADWTYAAPSGFGEATAPAVTWNPLDKHANVELSNGNLTAGLSASFSNGALVRATVSKDAGKWYWEITCHSNPSFTMTGMGSSTEPLDRHLAQWGSGRLDAYGYRNSGNVRELVDGAADVKASGITYGINDVIMIAVDFDAGKIWWGKNGTWVLSGDPGAGTNESWSSVSGEFFPAVSQTSDADSVTANFGATAFVYTPPTGFSGIGAAEPPVPDPSSTIVEVEEIVGFSSVLEGDKDIIGKEEEITGFEDSFVILNPTYTETSEEIGFTENFSAEALVGDPVEEEAGFDDTLEGYSLSPVLEDEEIGFEDTLDAFSLSPSSDEAFGFWDEWYVGVDKSLTFFNTYHIHSTSSFTVTTTFEAPRGDVETELEFFEVETFGNSYVFEELEAFEKDIIEGTLGTISAVETELAPLEVSCLGGDGVATVLEGIEKDVITGTLGILGSCDLELAPLESSSQGVQGVLGTVDTELPALEALILASGMGGYVSDSLCALVGSASGLVGSYVSVAASLEALEADVSGMTSDGEVSAIELCPIWAYGFGSVKNRFDDYLLQHIR